MCNDISGKFKNSLIPTCIVALTNRVKYPNLGTFVNVLYFALPNVLHNIF